MDRATRRVLLAMATVDYEGPSGGWISEHEVWRACRVPRTRLFAVLSRLQDRQMVERRQSDGPGGEVHYRFTVAGVTWAVWAARWPWSWWVLRWYRRRRESGRP
jgi:hypothetical protein